MSLINYLKKNAAEYLQTLFLLLVAFFITVFPILLGYFLKELNPSEYGLIRGRKEDLEITYKEILFFVSILLCFLLYSLSFRHLKNTFLKRILISFVSLYLIASALILLIDVLCYIVFAYRLTFSAVQTVLNTDAAEANSFVKLYLSKGILFSLLVFFLFIIFVLSKLAWFVKLFASQAFFTTACFLFCLGSADFAQMAHSKGNGPHNVRYWDILIGEYNEYNAFNRRLKAEKENQLLSKEYAAFYNNDTIPKTLVFVISESLSKRHMSLYNYARRTTPHLDTNRYIFKFNDCVSQAALTIDAVPALFISGYLSKQINLIVLLNKLGYQTTWISNQSGWGKGDKTIVLLSQLCRKTLFMDALADNDKANSSLHYDEDLLQHFSAALNSSPGVSKFIVLHLMGCHFEYEKRYPINKEVFHSDPPSKTAINTERTRNILNSYDNAMLYHDSVVNQILKTVSCSAANKNTALVFLSDHGEELYENRNYAGHSYPPTRQTSEIPYFTFLSSGFMQTYPELSATMKTRRNTPYSTANNFYTLLNLLNIGSGKYKSKLLSKGFFSPGYDSTQSRMVMGLDYSKME